MLVYLFWHAPVAGAEAAGYEAALAAFHDALHAAEPAGFHRSRAYRVEGGPWLPDGRGYEDWYEVHDSAALDPLDEAAVSARVLAVHDAAARRAAWGTAGLYQLLRPAPDPEPGPVSTCLWLRKPVGLGYAAFHVALDERAPGAAVWQRKMTFGPALEYCLVLPGEATAERLPSEWQPVPVRRHRVYE